MTIPEQSAAKPPMTPVPRPRLGFWRIFAMFIALVANAALVAGTVWAFSNPQRITDQFAYWQFEPSETLQVYAERSTMTEDGEFLFFASFPTIAEGDEFDDVCGSSAEDEFGILGCYLPGPKSIYLFDVTDERLDGIEEVVASHELLHAVWDRLTAEERDALEPLLEAEAEKLDGDEKFTERLQHYERIEPGERYNELHSIIGTEVPGISAALEEHYARYFEDRSAVTGLHEASNAVFVEHQEQIEALVAELDELALAIEADYAAYNAGYDKLNSDIGSFNSRADRGAFTSQSQFDRERNALLARQQGLDADYEAIEAMADQYDALVVQLDELNAEVDELNQSINITPRSADE